MIFYTQEHTRSYTFHDCTSLMHGNRYTFCGFCRWIRQGLQPGNLADTTLERFLTHLSPTFPEVFNIQDIEGNHERI